MMKKINIIAVFLFVLFSIFSSFQANAETAQEILGKAAAKAKASKGLDASFSASANGRSISGILKSSGTRFYVKTGGMESWYNGKDMYTYNPGTKETTVVKPSAAELSEVNPILFLNSYPTYFNASFSNNKQTGKYVIDLKAKSRKAPAKKVTVILNSKTLSPEKFIITSPDGSITNMTITKINFGASFASSVFECPPTRKTGLVDLR